MFIAPLVRMSTTSHPEETAEENVFHPNFNQADANIIIESNDGRKFRIHDYFLKANRYARL